MSSRIFIFGEAEKGDICAPLRFHSLKDLFNTLGQPPKESRGIDYAVQALLFKRELIFFRVQEEGFSFEEYMRGVKLLYKEGKQMNLSAIFVPGVGDTQIIDTLFPICKKIKSLLVFSEKDLYDFLTSSKY